MSIWLRRLLPWLVVAILAVAAWGLWPRGSGVAPSALDPTALLAALSVVEPKPEAAGRPAAAPPPGGDWVPQLPRDLGPHPGAAAEVWDLGGELREAGGERYGLRLTLVRMRLSAQPQPRASGLAARVLLLGRLELVPETGAPITAERSSRVAAGLAGVDADPPRLWLEDWTLRPDAGAAPGEAGRLRARLDDFDLDLELTAVKPAVAPAAELLDGGDTGADPAAGPDFRWLVQPRLKLTGRLTRAGEERAVSGGGWLERVWGDAASAGGVVGTRGQLALNRFLLQLDDGSELLCIQLRRRAGGGTPIPSCLLIAEDGATRLLQRRDLTLVPGDASWRSRLDATRYPTAWRLAIPALDLDLRIDALRPDRELNLGQRLWSGTIDVAGERAGRPVSGAGRMDLSGYADPPRG